MISKPIFIIGNPRSGTSMIYYLMAAHPDLCYPDMAYHGFLSNPNYSRLDRFYVPKFILRKIHKSLLPSPHTVKYEEGLKFLKLDPYIPKEGRFLWDPFLIENNLDWQVFKPEHLTQHPGVERRVKSRYENILKIRGKSRLLDKCPNYTLAIDVIRELFPDAYFVNVIRDGRAVVNSIVYAFRYRKLANGSDWRKKRLWWGSAPENWEELQNLSDLERACHQWNYHIKTARNAQKQLGNKYYEIRYENVVVNTQQEMSNLFECLELDKFGESLYLQNMDNRNYKWQAKHGNTFNDPIWTNRCAIKPEEYYHLEIMRPYLEELGYLA